MATEIEPFTLLDFTKRYGPNGEITRVAETLNKLNPMVQDGMVVEANRINSHYHSERTGLPGGTWFAAGEGVDGVKGTTKQVEDICGMVGNHTDVSEEVARQSGNIAKVRADLAVDAMEGLAREVGEALIYADFKTNPKKISGFASRYNAIGTWSSTTAAKNVVSAGGDTANACSSIWLITWGERRSYMFFPKGSTAGIQHNDLCSNGKPIQLFDDNNKPYLGYTDFFTWHVGLAIENWNYCGRLCNIDADTTASKLIDSLGTLTSRVKRDAAGSRSFLYMSPEMLDRLTKALSNQSSMNFTPAQPTMNLIPSFNGIQIHQCDYCVNTEAVVTATA